MCNFAACVYESNTEGYIILDLFDYKNLPSTECFTFTMLFYTHMGFQYAI